MTDTEKMLKIMTHARNMIGNDIEPVDDAWVRVEQLGNSLELHYGYTGLDDILDDWFDDSSLKSTVPSERHLLYVDRYGKSYLATNTDLSNACQKCINQLRK